MANVQFGNYTPTEEPKDTTEYVYYTREGEYLGGVAGSAKIFLTTKEKYDAAVTAKDFSTVNDEATLVKYDDKAMTHSDFRYIAYVVKQESGETDIKELRCIAFASHNRSVNTKKTWRALLASSYSSVPDKKELPDKNDDKSKLTRQAELDVLNGVEDLTKGAEFWDGTDFLAWGNSEQNPYNKLGQNKFDEYKFIEIPKDVYDAFLAAQNTTSTTYGDSGNHDLQHDHGTHEHIKVKNKKTGVEKSKLRYDIPAAEFKDQQYWTSGSFYYETGAKVTNGISATISAGKSIFWKVTATRLTSATAQPAQPGQPQTGQPPQQPGQPPQQPGQPPRQPGQPPQQPGQPPRPGGPPQQPPRPGGQPPLQPPRQ